MAKRQRSRLRRYGIAVFAVLLALISTLLLGWIIPPPDTRVSFALFYAAVIVSTLYGGRGPALLATLLSAISGGYIVQEFAGVPVGDGLEHLEQTAVFIAVALLIVFLTDARKRAEDAAYEQRERLRVTLASIGDAVIATDERGRITFMNRVASSLTGWGMREVLGKPLGEVFVVVNDLTHERLPDPVTEIIRHGDVVALAYRSTLVARDGTELPIDDTGAPIIDADGKVIGVILVFHNISERKKAEEALKASEERYRELFENANDILYTHDLEGNLTSVNRMGERLMGLPREEMIGKAITSVVPHEHREAALSMLARKLAGEPETSYELEITTLDGRRLVFEVSTRLIIENSKPAGVQGIARDITERKRAEKEREHLLARERAARAEAEAANRSKDEFLATVSHELRTPLSAILGWAHMLRHSKLDAATTQRALETIERNARSQAQIIEDILDVSRIVTGKLRLDVMPVELAPVAEAAVEAVRPAAEAKGIHLETALDRSAGPVSADPNRMQQVVWNLLSNAVKFTPRGGRVSLKLERVRSQVEISVCDNGQGITADFLPFVFDRFRQADSTTTRKHSGLGLGLALVRYLVEMHGGSVSASSGGEGLGSIFTISIPLSVSSPDVTLERRHVVLHETAEPRLPSLAGLRMLVVDDEPDTREVLKVMLSRYGAEVTACASTSEAMEALVETKPHVLVSDIEMPGEDGYELIKRVRALEPEHGGRIPAIALTAYGRIDDRLRSLSAGYQLHIAKPVDPEELAALVASVASRTGRYHLRPDSPVRAT